MAENDKPIKTKIVAQKSFKNEKIQPTKNAKTPCFIDLFALPVKEQTQHLELIKLPKMHVLGDLPIDQLGPQYRFAA